MVFPINYLDEHEHVPVKLFAISKFPTERVSEIAFKSL